MACEKCANVTHSGPTPEQQYVDPFSIDPPPCHYQCPGCGQRFWNTGENASGMWVKVHDDKAALAIACQSAVSIEGDTAFAI